ncbi:MAG: ABC-2 type transport system ATP-binding protein [Clostridium sp.]|jgi:ABC-2 type transport system ATP-binding protein
MGFIGPNGSGKSTTIKSIMNLIKKDSGIIRILVWTALKTKGKSKKK